jgi:hypothetical protein
MAKRRRHVSPEERARRGEWARTLKPPSHMDEETRRQHDLDRLRRACEPYGIDPQHAMEAVYPMVECDGIKLTTAVSRYLSEVQKPAEPVTNDITKPSLSASLSADGDDAAMDGAAERSMAEPDGVQDEVPPEPVDVPLEYNSANLRRAAEIQLRADLEADRDSPEAAAARSFAARYRNPPATQTTHRTYHELEQLRRRHRP